MLVSMVSACSTSKAFTQHCSMLSPSNTNHSSTALLTSCPSQHFRSWNFRNEPAVGPVLRRITTIAQLFRGGEADACRSKCCDFLLLGRTIMNASWPNSKFYCVFSHQPCYVELCFQSRNTCQSIGLYPVSQLPATMTAALPQRRSRTTRRTFERTLI
jgi:hypothetical protein